MTDGPASDDAASAGAASAGATPDDPRFATAWVHAFEEDTADGAVYRPADADLPLSRRPRERLELSPDGSARAYRPGHDDRPRPRPAAWRYAGTGAAAERDATPAYEIVDWGADRLVVRRPPDARG